MKFREIQTNVVKISCFAKFSSNFMKFREIQANVVKMSCFAKFSSNFAKFSSNFAKFREFQIISLKFCVSRNLHNAISHQPYVEVEEEEGGEWGVGGVRRIPPCVPSLLKQIVPISVSIYYVFHSVIYNSVALRNIRIQSII